MRDESMEEIQKENPIKDWFVDWTSDWFGLFDLIVGIITFTWWYPDTQGWWFRMWDR